MRVIFNPIMKLLQISHETWCVLKFALHILYAKLNKNVAFYFFTRTYFSCFLHFMFNIYFFESIIRKTPNLHWCKIKVHQIVVENYFTDKEKPVSLIKISSINFHWFRNYLLWYFHLFKYDFALSFNYVLEVMFSNNGFRNVGL